MRRKSLCASTIFIIFVITLLVVPSVEYASISQNPDSNPGHYYTANYTITFNITFTNTGSVPVTNLRVWLSRVNTWFAGVDGLVTVQNSSLLSITPTPNSVLQGVNNPNNTLLYYTTNIPVGGSFNITVVYSVVSIDTKWMVNPALVGEYDTSSSLYINHTQPEPFIQSNDSEIVALASSITAGITNPYLKAKAIYDWVSSNIAYSLQSEEKGALWALENRVGDCSEFSDLFIALSRAAGIPSRKVTGWAFSNLIGNPLLGTYEYENYPGHAWAEIYLENYGWISVDPTWASSGYYYFGKMDAFHLITCKGQNVTVPNNSFIEFSSLHYEWAGSLHLEETFQITINLIRLSTTTIAYNLEFIIVLIVSVGAVVVLFAFISKKTISV
ncbi:MAG: transglutaminase-like domain-containing protein [Candidatus Odinarchaeia archaeon]